MGYKMMCFESFCIVVNNAAKIINYTIRIV